MKPSNYLILSLLIHSLIIISTDSKCPHYFHCGTLTLKFPFSETTNPDCGFFMVDGCNSSQEYPKIQLAGGIRYDLLHVWENNMSVRDTELQKLLKENSYFALRNVSLSKSAFASLALAPPYLPVFSCKNEPYLYCKEESSNDINCSHLTLFYDHMHAAVNLTATAKDLSECSMIQLPISLPPHKNIHFLFDLLTDEFVLEWNVSEYCYKCYLGGGQCISYSIYDFYCKKGSSNRLVLILALSGVGLLFLLCCLLIFYIIWLRKKRVGLGYLRSAKISLGPSKSDIGGAGGSSFFGIPIFSYSQLEAATHNFDPSRELGDGGFGTVYYGKLLDGREVAIKRLYEQNCRRVEQFMNEIKILTSLKHPNLVCLYGCTSRRSRELLLVYEYVPNGTVADHLHGERADAAPLRWPIRMRIAIETATALAYLHKSDIIHRDVKTDNILLDKNYVVKVADFGLSRLFPNAATHISTAPGGTPGYIDPDYHQCYQVTDKSDVYSFGVVLIELISSMRAVDVSRRTDEINLANLALNRIQRCAFDELIDPSLGYNLDAEVTRTTTSVAEIAFRCLQQEKEMRPSMAEVLAFLKDI